ncbi:MAG: hypothetical protein V2I33_21645 [Kangiellaceae bacterium]|nr:hypothetical protein [Kangiellaceae bacterium]
MTDYTTAVWPNDGKVKYLAREPCREEAEAVRYTLSLAPTNARVHVSNVSDAATLIDSTVGKHVASLTFETTAPFLHFALDNMELDERFKAAPTMRNEENRKALVGLVQSGNIAAVSSFH